MPRIKLREYRSSENAQLNGSWNIALRAPGSVEFGHLRRGRRKITAINHSLKSVNLVRSSCQARSLLLLLNFAAWGCERLA